MPRLAPPPLGASLLDYKDVKTFKRFFGRTSTIVFRYYYISSHVTICVDTFSRPVRLLLLRHQAQRVGGAGGRGRENRTENEIATETAEPATAAAADGEDDPRCCCPGRDPRHWFRCSPPFHNWRQCRGREDRTEEADQLGAAAREQRQQFVRVTVRFS